MRDKNLKYLVICESPNKTSHLQEYLKKAGYKIKVMASVGHIAEIANDKDSYYNTGIYIDEDFKLNLKVSDDKKAVVEKLKEQVAVADHVVLATDGDNEGAQISWSLIKYLKLEEGTYSRMITHEITPKAVVKAFENPVPLDTLNATASQARMTLDKLFGYRLSPISKTYVGAKSVGRCQSVGLKLICDREKEIQNFIPKKYIDLYLNFKKNKTEFAAKYIGTDKAPIDHLKTDKEVNAVKKACTGDYIVKSIVEKTQKELPKPPYITATLQQDISSRFGLKVKDIMSICQKLFEQGFITYHRSDSPTLSPEFIAVAKEYINNTYPGLYAGPAEHKKTGNEQDGHEAIRCTDITLTPNISGEKINNNLYKKIYDAIWQRTLQSLATPAEFAVQKIIITNNGQNFEFEQKVLKIPGFKKIGC